MTGLSKNFCSGSANTETRGNNSDRNVNDLIYLPGLEKDSKMLKVFLIKNRKPRKM
jgi:hypothetical protein